MINTPFIATATVATTPATITVECGIIPGLVLVLNRTTGAVGLWWDGLTAGYLMVLNAGASGSGGTTLKTSGGITPVENTYGSIDGFTLGTLTDFNDTATEVLDFIVFPQGRE